MNNNISTNTRREHFAHTVGLIFVAVIWIILCVCCQLTPESDFSDSERRKLATFPDTTVENILSGKFMTDFESYSLDQFPFRDKFRSIKALSALYGFGMKDNNDLYKAQGYIAKIEYPLNIKSLQNAANRFTSIYDKYISGKNSRVYLSIVPDKGYFLAGKYGYPSLDYGKLTSFMTKSMPFAEYIDIFPTLELSDYYKTDTHWKQEKLGETAEKILDTMSAKALTGTKENTADVDFYGVYHGQSALPGESEKIVYITSETIDNCVVNNVETGKSGDVYDMEKLKGKDPYEMYLSGACALLQIENPSAKQDRKLIVFRDSFGSSIAPLLFESYSHITIIDTRYIVSDLLGDYVEFDNADVLFIYSTLILNNSNMIK